MLPLQATSRPTTDGVDGCECNADRHSVSQAPSALTQPRRVGLGFLRPIPPEGPERCERQGQRDWLGTLVGLPAGPSRGQPIGRVGVTQGSPLPGAGCAAIDD
jgi:hypothetical protein